MTLENVTALSDDDAALPAAPGAEPAVVEPAPKASAKAKSTPKAKAQGKAKAHGKAKAKSKPKAGPMKRPAAAMASAPEEHEDPGPAGTSGKMKRPGAAPGAVLKCNKYIYTRDGVWGIKVNGAEIIRVMPSENGSANSTGFRVSVNIM